MLLSNLTKLPAPGSGTPPRYADVRTTVILRKTGVSGWKIIAARVADLRAENRR